MGITQEQIDRLSEYSDKELQDYMTEGHRRIVEDTVILNIGQLLENMEIVELEIARRKEINK